MTALTTLVLLAAPAHAARQALVIGNSAYTDGPLRNPVNDARAMDQKLTSLGFRVQRVENMKRQQIGRTLTAFANAIRPGDEVVVFYAGHGVQVKGINYLPAVDADIQSEEDVALNSLNLNSLMERLDEAKAGLKLLFLDACRNNPYARSFRSGDRGLARVGAAPSGTLIHFATRPGSVASDGTGANGLYTSQLIRHIDTPNMPVEIMLKRVAAAVETASKGTQDPWTEGSIRGDFYFKPSAGTTVASVAPEKVQQPSQTESVVGEVPVIGLAEFDGDAIETAATVRSVFRNNMERSKRILAQSADIKLGALKRPNFEEWANKGWMYVLSGTAKAAQDRRFDVSVRLWKVEPGGMRDLGGQSYSSIDQTDIRLLAHRISDYVYPKLVGEMSKFSSRLAYASDASGKWQLLIADFDGENRQHALTSPEVVGLPVWSSDGKFIAYVSYETKAPQVFVHEVSTGRRRPTTDAQGVLTNCAREIGLLYFASKNQHADLLKDTWIEGATAACSTAVRAIL